MKKTLIALLILIAAVISCEDHMNVATFVAGSLEGSVVEVTGGAPVQGVELILVDPEFLTPTSGLVTTDRNGKFKIEAVRPGDYSIFVYHDTLVVFDRSGPFVRIEEGTVSTYQIRMIGGQQGGNSGFRVSGTVLDDDTGETVVGAFVEGVYDAWNDLCPAFRGSTRSDWEVTDSEGRFSITVKAYYLDWRPVGLEPISVTRQGYLPYSLGGDGPKPGGYPPPLPMPAQDESTLVVEVRLQPLLHGGVGPDGVGKIRGRLTYLGAPVPGIRVATSMLSSAHPETLLAAPLDASVPIQGNVVITDSEGRFQIDQLIPGFYVVHPAYLPDDGYLHLDVQTLRVESSQTTDAHDVSVIKAIGPVHPPRRAVLSSPTPRFEWQIRPESAAYEFIEYKLHVQLGNRETVTVGGLTDTTWQLPDSLAFSPGASIRWDVEVIGSTNDLNPPETIATFETPATFTFAR